MRLFALFSPEIVAGVPPIIQFPRIMTQLGVLGISPRPAELPGVRLVDAGPLVQRPAPAVQLRQVGLLLLVTEIESFQIVYSIWVYMCQIPQSLSLPAKYTSY